jgi:protein-S-isoprenylcysteine O-methyltransferase Ste14
MTTGPYAQVRYPLHTAVIGYGMSIALLTSNWFFVGFAIIALIGVLARVPKEEQMMIQKLEEEYKAYM